MEKVTEKVINVGVNDYDITLFENQYKLEKGMAYNSYIILDDKVAVMDTVDQEVKEQWLTNLEEGLAGRKADYLIVQHMEPDHSGCIRDLIEKFPQMQIVGNAKTVPMLKQFLEVDVDSRTVIVKEGDTLNLGEHTLQFFMAPMVHWPEVMVTYEQSEKILFSADGFGKFGTRDADEDWENEARRYYYNICGKYGMQVQNLLKKAADLDIQIICSLHGPVLTENLKYYIGKYDIWSKYEPEEKGVLIACASIYGNTMKAAVKLKEILEEKGIEKVAIADLTKADKHQCVGEAFQYDCLVLAAASYDAGVFPPMEDFLNRLKAKNYQKRTVAIMENGSWGPTAARTMKGFIEGMKEIQLVEPVITIKSAMTSANVEQMEELADVLVG